MAMLTPPGTRSFSTARSIACLGDSISAANNSTPGAGQSFGARGFLAWAQILLRNRLDFDGALNFGVSGDTTTQMMSRLGLVLAARPAFCTVLGGTNDYPSLPASTTVANLKAILTALRKAGIRPVWLPVLPRDIASSNAQFICAVNWEMRQWCRSQDILISDVSEVWIDPATGTPKAAMTTDGLHPNTFGAYLIGAKLSQTLSPFVPSDDGLVYSPLDVFDATNNIYGALNANPLCTGTTGTKFTSVTGNYLASWSSQIVGGPAWTGTIVASKDTPTDGLGEWQRLTFTNFATASSSQALQFFHQLTLTGTSRLVGSRYQSMCDFEVVSNGGGLNMASLSTTENNGASNSGSSCLSGGSATDRLDPTALWSGVLRTAPVTMRAYSGSGSNTLQTTLQLLVDGTFAGGATFAVRFRRVATRYLPA